MKSKLLLCLALVLGGSLPGYSNDIKTNESNAANESNNSYSVIRKSDWTNTKIILYRSSGEAIQLDARSAICRFKANSTNWYDFLLVAFVDSKRSMAFIGLADGTQTNVMDFYVETGSGIVGVLNQLPAGSLIWQENSITNVISTTTLDGLTAQFESQPGLQEAADRCAWGRVKTQINLSPYFRIWFFYPHVYVSYMGSTPIQHIGVLDGKMWLHFTSPALKTPGSVWIDLKTWQLLKATENGVRVYPK